MAEQGAEGLLHVDAGCLNGVHVAVEFVVHPCVPVCQEDHHVGIRIKHPPQLESQHLPADVRFPAGFETDVAAQDTIATVRRAVVERIDEVLHADDFLNVAHHVQQTLLCVVVKFSEAVF